MARLALPLGLLALAALGWLILSPGGDGQPDGGRRADPRRRPHRRRPHPAPAAEPGRLAAARRRPRPQDRRRHRPPGPGDPLARRAHATVDGWEPVENPPHSWKNAQGTTPTASRATDGGQAVFASNAMSADLAALSPWLVGHQDAIPVRLEVYTVEEAEKPVAGSFETARGVTVYYKATLRHVGDPPYGPEFIELSLRPFPQAP
ncbi:MAG: hypothetical protein R3F43_13265 [bacterium]